MRARGIGVLIVTTLVVGASCGGSDDDAGRDATLPEVTLSPTTTTEPPFDETDDSIATDPDPTTVDDSEPTPSATDGEPSPGTADTTGGEGTISESAPAVTAAPDTTDAPADPAPTTIPASPFDLQTNGLGSASFGADPDGVVDFVTQFLGGPTDDTGWVDPFEIGPCGGTQIRQVRWGVLLLEFGDVSTITEGRPHFYGYYYGIDPQPPGAPLGIRTPEGITLGSTVAELLAAYPDATLRSADEFISANFFVNDNLRGLLTGLADDDTVTQIVGGMPCDG